MREQLTSDQRAFNSSERWSIQKPYMQSWKLHGSGQQKRLRKWCFQSSNISFSSCSSCSSCVHFLRRKQQFSRNYFKGEQGWWWLHPSQHKAIQQCTSHLLAKCLEQKAHKDRPADPSSFLPGLGGCYQCGGEKWRAEVAHGHQLRLYFALICRIKSQSVLGYVEIGDTMFSAFFCSV